MKRLFFPLPSALLGAAFNAMLIASPAVPGSLGQQLPGSITAPSGFILVQDTSPPIPMPTDASNVDFDGDGGSLMFESATPVKDLASFYREAMKGAGWKEVPSVINNDNMVVLDFSKGESALNLTLMTMGDHTQVTGTGDGLTGVEDASQSAGAASGDDASGQGLALTFTDKDGLPSPNEASSSGSESTLFRRSILATVETKIPSVVEMYRKELAAKGWTEMADKAKVSGDAASLFFDTPSGPGFFTAKRDGSYTNLQLGISDKAAASQSPLFPKPGQVKIAIGNITESAVTVKIAGKSVKVKAMAGSKEPDGPTLDVAPGTLTAEVKGAPPETIEAGPDQIWMVMVGPGGLLTIQAY